VATRPRVINEDAAAVLRQRRARLVAVGKHPDWEELVAEVEREQERKFKSLRHRIYSGGPDAKEVPQREIDYHRGFMAGARWVITLPRAAENRLEIELQGEK
jgi:hypothetical protein